MSELPLIPLRKYVKELSDEEIVTFQAFTKEAQQNLYNKLQPAKNPLLLEYAYRKHSTIIFKPESISISHRFNTLYLYTPAGTIGVQLSDEVLEEIANMQSSNIYFECELYKKIPVGIKNAIYLANIVAIYEADFDFDRAKELLNEYKPYELILLGLGYKPTNEALASKLPLILPLFQYNSRAIHTATFTPPRTGKSKAASLLRGLASAYLTTFPSPSKLIYDGAKGKYGLTYLYSTIYIDEFDKINAQKRRDMFRDTYETLLTGMSDGVWIREVSSKASDFQNLVGFCFMGNVENAELANYADLSDHSLTARNRLYKLLEDIVNPAPFIERIAYVEFLKKSPQAYELLNVNEDHQVLYLDPRITRAVIKLLQDETLNQPIHRNVESELDHHFNAIKSVLNVLQVELSDSTIESLVKSELTFTDVLTTDEKQESSIDYEELKAPDLSEMLMGDQL